MDQTVADHDVTLHAVWLVLALFFAGISSPATAQIPANMLGAEITPLSIAGSEAFVYRRVGDAELRLHVVKPRGWLSGDQRPALVAYFGGGWTSGTPERAMSWVKWAADQGLVGIACDYRTRNRFQATPEAAISDGRAALVWIAGHAAELGISSRKLVALGASSGGHIASWTAMKVPGPSADDPAPDVNPAGLILINPVSDTKLGGYGGPKRFDDNPARALAASVPDQMPDQMPPIIVFHGTADTTVPYVNSVALCEKLVAKGNRCELVTFEGADHSYYSYNRFGEKAEVALKDTHNAMATFLNSLGLIPAKK